jgi:hypothetical protein
MDTLPGLVLPCRGWCHVADTRPLALDACEDISCLHTCPLIFTQSMWLFAGVPRPSMGGGRGKCTYTLNRVITMVGDETGLCS